MELQPRGWQKKAFAKWLESDHKGVVSVVTGGGKTIFSFICAQRFLDLNTGGKVIIIVPTTSLLDQWVVSLQEDFSIPIKDIAWYSGEEKSGKPKKFNLVVINTARNIQDILKINSSDMLIVDECHRAGSRENSKALVGDYFATLGLSATPVREYDDGFEKYVKPALGEIIYEYDYEQAAKDEVIVGFDLTNVKIDFIGDEVDEYAKANKRVGSLLAQKKKGKDVEGRLKIALQKRASISANAILRIPIAAKLAHNHKGERTIVFHENVRSANKIAKILKGYGHNVVLYHTGISPTIRRDNLKLYRKGVFDVLVCCKALDEGMNAPETTVAIIASSTASLRQRIQRIGRVLRPAKGKSRAQIYTLYVTDQEQGRLLKEAQRLEGVAATNWLEGTYSSNGTASS